MTNSDVLPSYNGKGTRKPLSIPDKGYRFLFAAPAELDFNDPEWGFQKMPAFATWRANHIDMYKSRKSPTLSKQNAGEADKDFALRKKTYKLELESWLKDFE